LPYPPGTLDTEEGVPYPPGALDGAPYPPGRLVKVENSPPLLEATCVWIPEGSETVGKGRFPETVSVSVGRVTLVKVVVGSPSSSVQVEVLNALVVIGLVIGCPVGLPVPMIPVGRPVPVG
jgi:hypothetical protein